MTICFTSRTVLTLYSHDKVIFTTPLGNLTFRNSTLGSTLQPRCTRGAKPTKENAMRPTAGRSWCNNGGQFFNVLNMLANSIPQAQQDYVSSKAIAANLSGVRQCIEWRYSTLQCSIKTHFVSIAIAWIGPQLNKYTTIICLIGWKITQFTMANIWKLDMETLGFVHATKPD